MSERANASMIRLSPTSRPSSATVAATALRRSATAGWSSHGAILLVVVGLLVGCGGPAAVSLRNEWPQTPGSYHAVTQQWTRSASLSASYQQILSVDATFLSPQWRAAHAARQAELRGLGDQARAALVATAKEQAAGPWEVELLVTTWDRRENDLHRGKRSTWKVALLDEQGNEIAPIEIVRDRRPAYVVQAEFPKLGDFAQAYIARFPKEQPVLGPSVRVVRLRLTSARGAVELDWHAP